jgi:hypothetical protein
MFGLFLGATIGTTFGSESLALQRETASVRNVPSEYPAFQLQDLVN